MSWNKEWKALLITIVIFLTMYFLPVESERFTNSIIESLALVKWYAQEHVLLCLLPAFLIAGAVSIFISQNSVIKYFGAQANKIVSYGVASISGTVLAVCSCTILPLFAGIYRMGAGIGPATTFLYSGPAINVLAIILTARVLGFELGLARAVGAIVFSIVIGLLMHFIFLKEEREKANNGMQVALPDDEKSRSLFQNALFMGLMVAILIFANWGKSVDEAGLWHLIYSNKWIITSVFTVGFALTLITILKMEWWKVLLMAIFPVIFAIILPAYPVVSFTAGIIALSVISVQNGGESKDWINSSWGFAKQILPLLFIGVLIAGLLLGQPGSEGLIPSEWVAGLVGGNSIQANVFASVVGAFMYFATLTEVPILEGLINNGMGEGPALALLLAGPALSLPNMLVIRSIIGTKKTVVFVVLVIIMATISGIIYGSLF